MAMPAAEPVRGRFLPRLRDILASRPGRTAFAVRIALICTLTVLVGEINGIPEIALAAYVVFFMNNADRTRSVLAATLFLLLTNVPISTLVSNRNSVAARTLRVRSTVFMKNTT